MRWVIVAFGLLMAGSALAAPPQVVKPEGQIEIGVGESRTFRFDEPFKSFDTTNQDVLKILPQSDRTLTVTGVGLGQTLLFILDEQNSVIYSATVFVQPGHGRLVKLYGAGSKNKDFVGWYCNGVGWGRANLDKPDDPTSEAVTVTRPTDAGGSVSVTKQYGP